MTIIEVKRLLTELYPDWEWNLTPRVDMGIFSTNQAFKQAKALGKNPVEVATDLAQSLNLRLSQIPSNVLTARNVGPYINIYLNDDGWRSHLLNLNQINLYGSKDKIVLEYICPNVAKPLHAGHMLQGNFAESMRRILSIKYPNIITNNYWGDWGVQFGIVIWGWKQLMTYTQQVEVVINEIPQKLSLSNYASNPIDTLVKVYVWANTREKEVENWQDLVRQEHLKLEQGDKENQELWKMFVQDSMKSFKKTLHDLNIKDYDYEEGESDVEEEMKGLSRFLEDSGLWQSEGKGRYIDSEFIQQRLDPKMQISQADLKTFGRCYLIQSKNGYTTYALRDLAAKIKFARQWNFDRYITFVGSEQQHHFHQVYTILKFLRFIPAFETQYTSAVSSRLGPKNLGNIFNGMVSLANIKMSTRKGNFLSVEDLIREVKAQAIQTLQTKDPNLSEEEYSLRAHRVTLAALKWFNLNRDIGQNAVLDIPSILKFEGNTGVYQLYTVARLTSILRKNPAQNTEATTQDQSVYQYWDCLNQEEQNLVMQTYLLPDLLDRICSSYKPHYLTDYLFGLSNTINSWYSKYSVNQETNTLRKQAMLFMCLKLKEHLTHCLDLLAIPVLEEL